MDKKTIRTLLTICTGGLLVGALILFAVMLVTRERDSLTMTTAFLFLISGNLLNIVRHHLDSEDKE